MKIRKEQMDALRKSREDAFVARMVKHLRNDFRKGRVTQHIAEGDLEALVRRGITDAEKYGVIYEDDVRLYIECMVVLGPMFDQDQRCGWAGELLRQEGLDGTTKMDQIDQYLIFGTAEPS